ncbi:hypothetical protein GCM10022393_12410 [Aquimarina addita]|uniref:Uncharacterized protein n=1 Tax=Aquimarina addita TaxID=870485 RepID=A0ABP7XFR1_9FLAO
MSCDTKLKEIPLDEISKDLKWNADKSAESILGFCDSEEDFETFKMRSSVKSRMHIHTGKYNLACYVYANDVSEISLGKLYRVNRLKGGVKKFKYKLAIKSQRFEFMELHVDLNSEKFIANYKIYGKEKGEEWISVLDDLELEVRKVVKENK